MFERLKTTGLATNLAKASSGPEAKVFNAGVGGDKIENVLYRLELGLFDHFSAGEEGETRKGELITVVVMVGTNNLGKNGWKSEGKEVVAYRVLLEALVRMCDAEKGRVFCCEMFRRKDVDEGIVDAANGLLREVIVGLNREYGKERILWIERPSEIGLGRLVDHVHLDEEGYRIWDEVLCERIGLKAEGEEL